jgi:hypothetical protein
MPLHSPLQQSLFQLTFDCGRQGLRLERDECEVIPEAMKALQVGEDLGPHERFPDPVQ